MRVLRRNGVRSRNLIRWFPRLEIEHLWIALPLFLIVWKGFLTQLPLYDFWWHLKVGEFIATTGSIPQEDLFSFTATGRSFIVHNWLAEVIYYGLFRAGGLSMIVFFNSLLLVAALVPVYHLCLKSTDRARVAALVALVAAIGMFPHTRPQVFSFVCLSLYYWVLTLYRWKEKNYLWMLPVVMLLWVNLHGGFVLGLFVVGLVLGCEWLRSVVVGGPNSLSKNELMKLLFSMVLCAIATLVNPELHNVYGYVYSVVTDPSSRMFVMEWQPPRVMSLQGWVLFYASFFMTIVALIYSRVRVNLTDLMLIGAFAILAISALRHSIWFALIMPPILTRHLGALDIAWGRVADWRLSKVLQGWTADRRVRRSRYRWNAGLASIMVLLVVMQSPWIRPRLYGTSLVSAMTPIGAMDFIERQQLSGNILHPQVYGDYLMWRLWPKQKSFFDGRVHVFGEEFVRFYQEIFADTQWENFLAKYDIRYLLLSKDESEAGSVRMIEAAHTSGRWRTLYEDSLSVLLEDREGKTAEIGMSLD